MILVFFMPKFTNPKLSKGFFFLVKENEEYFGILGLAYDLGHLSSPS
jgi:hypothetical protein